MVSLGLVSSSITSSILRPAMPPPALNFSTAHCVARSPLSPALAAIPERGARMPTRQGLAWAMAGANTPGAVAPAPAAANEVSRARRESFIGRPLICASVAPSAGGVGAHDISATCQQQRSRAEAGGRGAATLVVGPAGANPAGGNCPVATVVISGNGEGDRAVESPEVKVSCKGGEQLSRS